MHRRRRRANRRTIMGNPKFPVNKGGLCVKGWTAGGDARSSRRLITPLVRRRDGQLVPATWDAALDRIAQALPGSSSRQHGRDAVGVFGGGSLTNEKAYLLGKFARVALGTANIDYNGRFCMSSAAAAAIEGVRPRSRPAVSARGHRRTPTSSCSSAPTSPRRCRRSCGTSRRSSATAARSSSSIRGARHRAVGDAAPAAAAGLRRRARQRPAARADSRRPGRRGLHPRAHRGVRRGARAWPRPTGRSGSSASPACPKADRRGRRASLGSARSAMVLTARGAEQQAQGVDNTLAYINLALALGQVGAPFSGFGTHHRPGQRPGRPRARAEGRPAARLPPHRRSRRARARRRASGACAGAICRARAGPRTSCSTRIGAPDGIRALFVMGSNPVVSAPDALARRGAARGARLPRRLRLLPVRDGAARRRRPARARSGPKRTAR